MPWIVFPRCSDSCCSYAIEFIYLVAPYWAQLWLWCLEYCSTLADLMYLVQNPTELCIWEFCNVQLGFFLLCLGHMRASNRVEHYFLFLIRLGALRNFGCQKNFWKILYIDGSFSFWLEDSSFLQFPCLTASQFVPWKACMIVLLNSTARKF